MFGSNYSFPDEYYLNSDGEFVCADVSVLNFQAWLRATFPDSRIRNGSLAVKMAKEVVKRDDAASYRDTLAAAFAEMGHFDAAVREQQRAINMLRLSGSMKDIAEYKQRLQLYKQGKPYRQAR